MGTLSVPGVKSARCKVSPWLTNQTEPLQERGKPLRERESNCHLISSSRAQGAEGLRALLRDDMMVQM
jgi:hypothetical protein